MSADDAVPTMSSGLRSQCPVSFFKPTRGNKVFRGVGTVVGGNHIDYVVAREEGGSVEVDQLYRYKLWDVAEGDASTVKYEVVSKVRGLIAADIGGNAAVNVVTVR